MSSSANKIFFFHIISILSMTIFAQEIETSGSKLTNISGTAADPLVKLTEQDPIKGYIESCKNLKPNQTQEEILNCVWEDNLTDDEKDQIFSLLNSNTENPERGSEFDVGIGNFKKEKSSATKVLENYLVKRLEEVMYGDEDKKNLKVARDHTDFYRIYQSQLGKNLITEMSSFCIYSDDKGEIPFSRLKDLQTNKQTNLDNLNQVDSKSGRTLSFKGYESCIIKISEYCEKGSKFTSKLTDPVVSPCELNRLMTAVKRALTKTEDLIDTFEKRGVERGIAMAEINDERIDIQDVVNLGSQEIVSDSGYEEEMKKVAQEIKDNCVGVTDPEDDPICEKYLTKKTENDEIILEYKLRNKALVEKVKKRLETPTEENLKAVLKEQGLSDEEYEELKLKVQNELASSAQSCATIEDCIKEKITNRYENERDQLGKSLQKRLESTQYDDSDEATSSGSESKLANLANSYDTSAESLAAIYQYSNIVSSFIRIGSEDDGRTNTAALAAELESNYFSADSSGGRETASNGSQSQTVRDLSSLSGLGSKSDDKDPVNLESSQINMIQGWKENKEENP